MSRAAPAACPAFLRRVEMVQTTPAFRSNEDTSQHFCLFIGNISNEIDDNVRSGAAPPLLPFSEHICVARAHC